MALNKEYSYVEQTKWYICQDCGYDREGDYEPDYCPDCGSLHFEMEPMELKWC